MIKRWMDKFRQIFGNNTFRTDLKNEGRRGANLLTVSWRAAVVAALLGGALASALLLQNALGIILAAALGGAALLSSVRLIGWGLKWVKNKRVSELGLNIVRFSVIITAVVLTIFIMLSIDYTRQHADAAASDLMETTLAGRLYIQSKITDNPVKIVDVDADEGEGEAVSGGDQAISEGDVIPPEPEHEPHPLQKDVDAFF
ncbi:MAG: hypothetical protein FWE86_04135, partial [Oscillospiraceae bacterium]|nr:hypothetical protein [Oscillospiraceae bacterium]